MMFRVKNTLPQMIDGDGSSSGPESVDLIAEALRMGQTYWKLICAWVAGFVVLAAIISFLMPPTYIVSAEILMLNKRLAEPGAIESNRNAYVRYESPQADDLQTEIRILETSALLSGAVERMSNPRAKGAVELRGAPASPPVITEDEMANIADSLSFSVVPGAHVILAELHTGDADFGKRFLDAFTAEYITQRPKILSNDSAIATHRQNRDFYKERLDELEERLTALQKESTVGDLEQEKAIRLQHVEKELTAVSQLRDRVVEVGQLLEYLEGAVEDYRSGQLEAPPSTPARLGDEELREANARLFATLNDLQTRRATYTPKSEAVRAARAAYSRQKISYFNLIDRKVDELKGEKRALEAAIDDKHQRIATLSDRSSKLQDTLAVRETIAIERAAAQDAFLAASARLDAAEARRTSEYSGFSNVRILQPAETPQSPSSPNLKLNLVLGFLTGLMVAAIHVLLKDMSSPHIRSEKEVEKLLGLPVIELYAMTTRV